jgi:hypothetical protein
MNTDEFLRVFVDHAGPKLDTYEQAIYLYLVRRTHLDGLTAILVPVESASIRTAAGIAKKGARISRDVYRNKLQSLERKEFLSIMGKEYRGTRIRVFLPIEIPGVIPEIKPADPTDLEKLDFFTVPENRDAILAREKGRCFYCMVLLNHKNRVIDHIVPHPKGDNSHRNCVAACLQCNSEKGQVPADDFLRALCRKGRLRADELDSRLDALLLIKDGKAPPIVAPSGDRLELTGNWRLGTGN